jgi:drug/metabolite transporter (DMT)-like permease
MTGLAVSIGLVIMWSSGFIGAELGTREASTDTLLMWRFLAATALLGVGWLIFRRRRLPLRAVGEQALIGLLSQGVYLGSIVGAIELGVPAGTTALIAAVQPLLAGTLAGPLLGERVSARRWIGLGAGLGGVALVVSDDLSVGGASPTAFLLPFAGMAALLAASVLERRSRNPVRLADALPIHSLVSAAALTVPALATGAAQPPSDGGFWFAVGWLVLLSTLGGYGCYWLSLRRHGVTHTSVLIYLTPPTTAGWAYLMFADPVGSWSVLGMAVCLGSVIAATGPHRAARHRDRVEA